MESSRGDLLNDMAEHRSILKNVQNTYYPRFSFIPKTDKAFIKVGVLFLLCIALAKLETLMELPAPCPLAVSVQKVLHGST